MHRCAISHRIINTLTFGALVSFAAAAGAQAVAPIGTTPVHPISGGGTTTASTGASRNPAVLHGAKVVTPTSSIALAADLGKKVHTNLLVLNPGTATPLEAPPFSGYAYE